MPLEKKFFSYKIFLFLTKNIHEERMMTSSYYSLPSQDLLMQYHEVTCFSHQQMPGRDLHELRICLILHDGFT